MKTRPPIKCPAKSQNFLKRGRRGSLSLPGLSLVTQCISPHCGKREGWRKPGAVAGLFVWALMCGVCGRRCGMLCTPQTKNHLAKVSSAKQREFTGVVMETACGGKRFEAAAAAHRTLAQ